MLRRATYVGSLGFCLKLGLGAGISRAISGPLRAADAPRTSRAPQVRGHPPAARRPVAALGRGRHRRPEVARANESAIS